MYTAMKSEQANEKQHIIFGLEVWKDDELTIWLLYIFYQFACRALFNLQNRNCWEKGLLWTKFGLPQYELRFEWKMLILLSTQQPQSYIV